MTSNDKMTNYIHYLRNTYGLEMSGLFESVEDFANTKSIISDDRKYLLSVFGYTETSLDFDQYREMMRSELRKKNSRFQLDEGLAFIRLCILVTMFDRYLDKAPENDDDFRQYCLSHPLWPRIEKQARVTLELFKKNKSLRSLTSPKP